MLEDNSFSEGIKHHVVGKIIRIDDKSKRESERWELKRSALTLPGLPPGAERYWDLEASESRDMSAIGVSSPSSPIMAPIDAVIALSV